MTATVGADRRSDGLTSDHLAVAKPPLIIPGHDNRQREENTGRGQIGVDLDLGCRITISQIVNYTINVRPQTLVGLPRDASSDNEVALRAPQLRTHTQ